MIVCKNCSYASNPESRVCKCCDNKDLFIPISLKSKEMIQFNPEAKILHLTLKKQWFDAVCKDKKEEYREIKPFWYSRLIDTGRGKVMMKECCANLMNPNSASLWNFEHGYYPRKSFDYVSFKNGYRKDAPNIVFEFKGTHIGTGKEEWGAEKGKRYFVIKLGEMVAFAL